MNKVILLGRLTRDPETRYSQNGSDQMCIARYTLAVDRRGKKHKGESDAPRYKALGNSIALPFWEWMAQRMVEQLKADGVENPTMASLFDGIGGFPLVYQRCGCEPVWASEIEEFPIAVTKIRFPDEGEKNE